MVLLRRLDRDQPIVNPVDDQRRYRDPLEDATKWPLVRVEEVPRIRNTQRCVVQKAQVGRSLASKPQSTELGSMHNVVHVRVAR